MTRHGVFAVFKNDKIKLAYLFDDQNVTPIKEAIGQKIDSFEKNYFNVLESLAHEMMNLSRGELFVKHSADNMTLAFRQLENYFFLVIMKTKGDIKGFANELYDKLTDKGTYGILKKHCKGENLKLTELLSVNTFKTIFKGLLKTHKINLID